MTWDPYLDLQSGLLRNRLGITDARALRHLEAELTASRIYDLIRSPIPGAYDLAHLRAFHRQIFQDLYDWAGELRTVSIGRGRLFSLPQHLEADAGELFGWLARAEYLRGRDRAAFVDDLTELYADLNALHPFRDGNGRTQRAFLGQLAVDAGHPIHWAAMDPAENNAASKAAEEGDNDALRALLDLLVHRR
ncbi:MAG TPA: Fic family protein [Pseudonocardia sp.]|nr:Fic family protein [Pseudonocardia sp.]